MSLDYAQLAGQTVADFSREPVIEVTPIIEKGSVNQIFVVRTGTGSLIVRLNEAEHYFEEYERERRCIEQAAYIGVPGPVVLETGTVGAAAYMIESLIEGENGEDSSPDKLELWQKLGHYARLIHSIKAVPSPGLELTNFDNFAITWQGFLNYNIESLTEDDPLIKLGVFDKTQIIEIKRNFEALRNRKYNFGLVHSDLAPRNTIVEPSGRVSLLDWGCAEINIVPHTELVVLLGWQINEYYPSEVEFKAFLRGYGLSWADYELLKPEVEILLLLRSIDTVRWAIERKPDRVQPLAAKAKKVRETLFPEL